MRLTSDFPFWSVRDGLPVSYPALREDVKCEALMVGAGISGAMAALHLVEAGVERPGAMLLVERRA